MSIADPVSPPVALYINEITSTSIVVSWRTEPLIEYVVEVVSLSSNIQRCTSNSRQSPPVSKSLPENV